MIQSFYQILSVAGDFLQVAEDRWTRSVIRFPTLVSSGKSGVCTHPIGTTESQCPSSAPVACFWLPPHLQCRRPGFDPGSGRSPGEGNGNPVYYSCLENPHGQRSLVGNSSWGHKESDVTEPLSTAPIFVREHIRFFERV